LSKEQKSGFIATKSPFIRNEAPDLLSDNLFKTGNSAFWEGYFKMKPLIEHAYEEFIKSRKRKRRKK
jgi:hypothetical protein